MNIKYILGLPEIYSKYSSGILSLEYTKYGGLPQIKSYFFVIEYFRKSLLCNTTLFLNFN